MRETDLRKEILQIIEAAKTPLTVKEIHEALRRKPDISSVYRALQSFLKKGKVQSVSFSGNTQYYYANCQTHCHFVVCRKCNRIDRFNRCLADQLEAHVKEKFDYLITNHVFYFQGVCRPCREKILLEA